MLPDFNKNLVTIVLTVICIYAMTRGLDNMAENCIIIIASLATGERVASSIGGKKNEITKKAKRVSKKSSQAD